MSGKVKDVLEVLGPEPWECPQSRAGTPAAVPQVPSVFEQVVAIIIVLFTSTLSLNRGIREH